MADKEQVIQALRATLISVKGALTIKQCNRDYRELQGESIPYKRLGYPSLEKLFVDVPGFKVTQVNGDWLVDAIASQESQHIANMVARQKSNKRVAPRNYSNRFPKRQESWRRPASSNYYAPNYGNEYSNQYYRAKGGTQNNNSYNKCYYKYPKTYDTKTAAPASKISTRLLTDNEDKNESNITKSSNYQSIDLKKIGKITIDDTKHSIKRSVEIKSIVKPSAKVPVSQRMSNLREQSLIPLQFPATNHDISVNKENDDPVTHLAPVHNLEPPPDFASVVEKLEWTCRKLGLPHPIYKTHTSPPIKRGSAPSAFSQIKIGTTYTSTSYPESSPTEEIAKELAAVKILAVIESSEALGLPIATSSKAISCLSDLVAEHEAGLWANTVPHLYREKYGENLPSNWQDLLESCPHIIKDRAFNGHLVLVPNNKPPSPALSDDTIDTDLPPLPFPEDDFWNVFITVANSTLEIWFRIIGPQYSDMFETLLADMAEYYEVYGSHVEKSRILQNSWYAVDLDDGGWLRAKILEVHEDTATIFLGDHGDDDEVSLDKIKILEPQFRKLPAQAVLCRLESAEELAASALGAELVRRRLPGEVLVAAPGPRHDPSDPSIAVVLYDTSTPRDLNLNKEIVNDFCIAGAFTITHKLCEVEVGCVSEEGEVWVSRAGGGRVVSDALALLTAGPYRRPLPAAPQAPNPAPNARYIVRTLHGDWVRCKIISGLDGEGTVRTQLVDSGLVLRAPLSSLVPLQTFSPALNAYPPQAMQVRLGAADRAVSSMVPRLRELLLNARVLCRALPSPVTTATINAANSPPHVELFARMGPNEILLPVNNTILIEFEVLNQINIKEQNEKDATNSVEALHRKKERIFRSLSGGVGTVPAVTSASDTRPHSGTTHNGLPPHALPSVGQCFDVHISMAANPWNFVVQPNSTRHTLQSMMSMLQIECPKFSELDVPPNPASGELYTVLYEKDATWYRVVVAGSVSSETVSVYFCDFGDLALVETRALRPAPRAVPLARALPPQAIKARLYDVCPLHQDWTVEDCIRFQELCVDQQFVGICKEVGKDPLNPNEPLLTLDLIDTSTEEDIYLNKQLVAENRARLASS